MHKWGGRGGAGDWKHGCFKSYRPELPGLGKAGGCIGDATTLQIFRHKLARVAA
jgi:hypothetical protein